MLLKHTLPADEPNSLTEGEAKGEYLLEHMRRGWEMHGDQTEALLSSLVGAAG